ncbi:MAG: hypothetical protein BWY68_00031 [bacterium ADurb.Bin400]|nr:MAG: hypothetical protein BWY68_00031 [bacterium ADurb.Bin400]
MKCPTCNVNLVMSERKGVEIDYCPECRGVWLDRGELDKIIDKSVSQPVPQEIRHTDRQDNRHIEHRHEDDYYKKRKKESWLGEIFDF